MLITIACARGHAGMKGALGDVVAAWVAGEEPSPRAFSPREHREFWIQEVDPEPEIGPEPGPAPRNATEEQLEAHAAQLRAYRAALDAEVESYRTRTWRCGTDGLSSATRAQLSRDVEIPRRALVGTIETTIETIEAA